MFQHAFEQHYRGNHKLSRQNSADYMRPSSEQQSESFGEDYFGSDNRYFGSGSTSRTKSLLKMTLKSSDGYQELPYFGSLLSPSSMAIIERNKGENWGFLQNVDEFYQGSPSDSPPLSSMNKYDPLQVE